MHTIMYNWWSFPSGSKFRPSLVQLRDKKHSSLLVMLVVLVEGHFNPGLFDHKLQPQTFEPWTFQPWYLQPRIFQPQTWVWKVWGWDVWGWKVHGWKVWDWKVQGWKVHGWRVRGWKVWGWSLGLKCPGLKFPSTIPRYCFQILYPKLLMLEIMLLNIRYAWLNKSISESIFQMWCKFTEQQCNALLCGN